MLLFLSLLLVVLVVAASYCCFFGHHQSRDRDEKQQTSVTDEVVFEGDFETADASQWGELQRNYHRAEKEQFEIVTTPRRQGHYAAKLTVHQGDRFAETVGDRCDLEQPGPHAKEGDDYWYAWSTLLANDWQPPTDWLVIIDWHSAYVDVCQLLQLQIDADNGLSAKILSGNVSGYDCYEGSGSAYSEQTLLMPRLHVDVWNDFIIHVKWTTDGNGIIEIWHRLEGEIAFRQLLLLADIPTLQYQGDKTKAGLPFLKLAHYRDEQTRHTTTLYHDGFHQAKRLSGLYKGALSLLDNRLIVEK